MHSGGYRVGGPGGSPGARGPSAVLARVVGAVVAVGFFVMAMFLGAFMFVALIVAGVVGTIAFRIWLWWQMRKMGDSAASAGLFNVGGRSPYGPPPTNPSPRSGSTIVDGEYDVLSGDDRRAGERDAQQGAAPGRKTDDADRRSR
jgi:hypothetical protein